MQVPSEATHQLEALPKPTLTTRNQQRELLSQRGRAIGSTVDPAERGQMGGVERPSPHLLLSSPPDSSPHGMGRKCRHVQRLLAPLCVVLSVLVVVLLVALIGESHRSIPMAGRWARDLFWGWSGEFQGFPSRMRSPPSIALSLLHGAPPFVP